MKILDRARAFWNASKLNKAIVHTVISLVFLIPFYFLFLKGNEDGPDTRQVDAREHFDTNEREGFKSRRPGYYTNNNPDKPNIEKEDDFFEIDEFQKQVDTLRAVVGSRRDSVIDKDSMEVERLRALILEQQKMAGARNRSPISVPGRTRNHGIGGGNPSTATTPEQRQEDYYQRLQRAKSEQLGKSGDITRAMESHGADGEGGQGHGILVRAVIYKDQLVLPGDRIKFILAEDMVHQGKLFERNTIVYATVGIEKSRVLLDIPNINGSPVSLQAMDIDDRKPGIYSQQAGNLWKQFKRDTDNVAEGSVSDGLEDVVGNTTIDRLVHSVGRFFKGKRVKDEEKILLVNDQEFLLADR